MVRNVIGLFFVEHVIVEALAVSPADVVQRLAELAAGDGTVGIEGALIVDAPEHAQIVRPQARRKYFSHALTR